MADVWKIGQNVKADEFYENAQYIVGNLFVLKSEIQGANRLTEVCNEMSETYNQIIDDQNDYMLEIDSSLDEISNLQQDLQKEIEKLNAREEELLEKKENGTIDPDEEKELESINGQIQGLQTQINGEVVTKNADVNEIAQEAEDTGERISKAEIAKDYGETAIEKGKPLSETKDKRKSFWRKTFGGWNKSAEREAGKKLLEAGNNLLGQVDTSAEIGEKISAKSKKSV